MTVELPGYYPATGDEGVHVGNDMAITDMALRTLRKRSKIFPHPPRSNGSQETEALPAGGGRTAKGREERLRQIRARLIEPSGPTSQLLRLLDRHPEVTNDLRRTR